VHFVVSVGAGVFVTAVVAGTIAIIHPFDAMQRPFIRDIVFYLAGVFWTFCVMWDKKITKIEAIGKCTMYCNKETRGHRQMYSDPLLYMYCLLF
jgi:Ca2+/Na+ antiporter